MKGIAPGLLLAALIAAPVMADTPAATAPATPPAAATGTATALLGPALHVSNIDRATRFYTDGLGMKLLMQMGPPNRHETMLGFASDPRAPGIILLSDSTVPAPPAITQSNGFDRLVVRVSNLPDVVERLHRLGYTASAVRDVTMGYRMALATDPEGYKLELVESGVKKGS